MSVKETKLILENWSNFVNEEKQRQLLEEKQIDEISNQLLKEHIESSDTELLQEAWWVPALAAARLGIPWAVRMTGKVLARVSPNTLRKLGYRVSSKGNPVRIANQHITGTTRLSRTLKKATDIAKKYPRINSLTKSFAEFTAWGAVIDGATGLMGDGESDEVSISDARARQVDAIDDAIKKLQKAEGTENEDQAVKDLEDALGKATDEAKSEVKKKKKTLKKIGGMKLRGAKTLQAAGYGKGLDPSKDYKKIYDEFYTALDGAGLINLLGKRGRDYMFGKKHKQALSALKSKKPAQAEKKPSSTDVNSAGTQAPAMSDKKEKPVTTVKRYTYKSPGQAIEAASRGELEPAYADNPAVKQALEKYKQS